MIDHLSHSQVNMLLRCGRQYEFRYVDGLKVPPAGALMLGRVWHKAIEHNYGQKVDSHEDLPVDDQREFFAARWDTEIEDEGGTAAVNWEDKKPGEYKDQGVALTALHQAELAPLVQPQLVEARFRVEFADVPDLVGVIDVVDEAGVVIDNKSAARSPNQDDVDRDIQLTAYALGYYTTLDAAEQVALRLDVAVKTKTPKAARVETVRTPDEMEWYLGLVRNAGALIQAGHFVPNPTGWWCSERFCGYWSRCKGRR